MKKDNMANKSAMIRFRMEEEHTKKIEILAKRIGLSGPQLARVWVLERLAKEEDNEIERDLKKFAEHKGITVKAACLLSASRRPT